MRVKSVPQQGSTLVFISKQNKCAVNTHLYTQQPGRHRR